MEAIGIPGKSSVFHNRECCRDGILYVLPLTEQEKKDYKEMREVLGTCFIHRENVIYESANYKRRCQKQEDIARTFVNVVYSLAKLCNYEMLTE